MPKDVPQPDMEAFPSLDEAKAIAERHFRVYDARSERIQGGIAAHRLYLMFDEVEFDARYEAVRKEFLRLDPDMLVFLRREGGEDILWIAPRPPVGPIRGRTNLILLALTLLTTTMAGAAYWQGYAHVGEAWSWSIFIDPGNLGWGFLTFALPLMAILGVHESAHYIAARRHGLRATLPYFIPIPPMIMPIGTLGALIRLKDPLPDRKALFDMGASGPLAGFALAVPLLLLGGFLTTDAAVEVPDMDRPDIQADAFVLEGTDPGKATLRLDPVTAGTHFFRVTAPDDDWSYTATATVTLEDGSERTDTFTSDLDRDEADLRTLEVPQNATAATVAIEWDDGLITFGDPLLVIALKPLLGEGDHLTHPTFFAAWVGILITGINLLPAGQLDGGHVARAVLGDRVRWAGMASMALLLFLTVRFSSWLLMAVFLILTGLYHPPPLNDRTPLDAKRKLVAVLVLLVFAISFVPVPIQV